MPTHLPTSKNSMLLAGCDGIEQHKFQSVLISVRLFGGRKATARLYVLVAGIATSENPVAPRQTATHACDGTLNIITLPPLAQRRGPSSRPAPSPCSGTPESETTSDQVSSSEASPWHFWVALWSRRAEVSGVCILQDAPEGLHEAGTKSGSASRSRLRLLQHADRTPRLLRQRSLLL
jgi:hypothetical protein